MTESIREQDSYLTEETNASYLVGSFDIRLSDVALKVGTRTVGRNAYAKYRADNGADVRSECLRDQ